jgi:hypothetical protein
MSKTAGDLEDRVRDWLSARNRDRLTPDQIYELMDEAGDELVDVFDIWFLKQWGSVVRSDSNAIWTTSSIPSPKDSNGAVLTAGQISAGSTPVNTEYLRALPYPERLTRPTIVYYGDFANEAELAYLHEDEFRASYLLSAAAGGTPLAYSLSGDSFLLGPTPAFDVTINVQGYYYDTRLEDEDDENQWTRHAPRLLVYKVQNLLIKYQYEEESRANLFADDYSRALRSVLAQSGRTFDNARQSRMQRKG